MPYIRVRPEGLQRMSEMLDRVEKDIEQREEAFSIVSRNLDWQVKREEDIDWQLRCICIELQEEKQKIAEIAEYLRRASVIYEKLEKNLQDEDERSLSYGTVYDQNEQETPFGTAYVAVYSWLLEVSQNIMKAVSEKNKDEVTGLAGVNRSLSSRQLKKYKFFLPVEIYLLAVFMQLASKFHVFPLALKFQDSFASVYCCSNLYNLRSFLREYLYQ